MAPAPGKLSAAARPVLVCPDKFRGSFSASAVAAAIAGELEKLGVPADICEIADGGEGTLRVLSAALGGEIVSAISRDALERPVEIEIGVFGDGRTAVVEAAQSIGLARLADDERDAWRATSYGVGEAIAVAAELNVREVVVGIGGTASVDGGAGAIAALRERGWPAPGERHGAARRPKLIGLCDARVSWEQAATLFAPQKGADPRTVARLSRRLEALAAELPADPRTQLMSGAGGGLAGGLWAACGAELKGGAAYVLDRLGFGERLRAARAVITGEGRLDRQTLLGKAVGEVATRARQGGVPCHAIAGDDAIDAFDARILDFESVHAATDKRAIRAATRRIAAQLATR